MLYFYDKGYRVTHMTDAAMAVRRRSATVTPWINALPTLPPWF